MSNILDKLDAKPTHQRAPLRQRLQMFEITMEETAVFQHRRYWQVEVRLGARAHIPEECRQSEVEDAKLRVKQVLAEEIFGEFRKPLLDALFAIDYGDAADAVEPIKVILSAMFGDRNW